MSDPSEAALVFEPFKYPAALKRAPRGVVAHFFAGLSAAFALGALAMVAEKWLPWFLFPPLYSALLLFCAERTAHVACIIETPRIKPLNFLVAFAFMYGGALAVDSLAEPLFEARWILAGLDWIAMGCAMRMALALNDASIARGLAKGFKDNARNALNILLSAGVAACLEWVFVAPFAFVIAPDDGVGHVVTLARTAFRLAILPAFFAGYWKKEAKAK